MGEEEMKITTTMKRRKMKKSKKNLPMIRR